MYTEYTINKIKESLACQMRKDRWNAGDHSEALKLELLQDIKQVITPRNSAKEEEI